MSFAQSIFLLTEPETSKSKSNWNMSSIVAFAPSTEPKICCSVSNDPFTFSSFRSNEFSSQPALTTLPLVLPWVIVSPSKNLTFSNCGSNVARLSFLITLPNSLDES